MKKSTKITLSFALLTTMIGSQVVLMNSAQANSTQANPTQATPTQAQQDDAAKKTAKKMAAKKALGETLDKAKLSYLTSDSGEYLAVDFKFPDRKRVQRVYISVLTDTTNNGSIRKIFSDPSENRVDDKALSYALMPEYEKIGAWQMHSYSNGLFFCAKVDAALSPEAMREVTEFVAKSVVDFEREMGIADAQ
ncbi:MAG: hypothetical protein HC860_12835 [Alkalinema sp. RU_4_3]|nr:hypothetical protein [Alkalinema sp. RU_4_3]